MNVIRMVKLFGWESKMTTRMDDARREELAWLWKRQVLEILNGTVKRVDFFLCDVFSPNDVPTAFWSQW